MGSELLLIRLLEIGDVLSYRDLGIRKRMKILYNLEDLTKEAFKIFRNRYTPAL
jgi:DNA-3-methyladenine glycosylase II